MDNKTLIIGVGTAATKILSKLNLEVPKLCLDTDKQILEKSFGMLIGFDVCKGISAGGDINCGELSVRENKVEILNRIKNFDRLIIVSPLGGGTSCGATKKIIELAIDNDKTVIVITNFPFDFEGHNRLYKATETLNYIKNLCEVTNIDKYDYTKILPREPMEQIFVKQDEIYLRAIDKFCV